MHNRMMLPCPTRLGLGNPNLGHLKQINQGMACSPCDLPNNSKRLCFLQYGISLVGFFVLETHVGLIIAFVSDTNHGLKKKRILLHNRMRDKSSESKEKDHLKSDIHGTGVTNIIGDI